MRPSRRFFSAAAGLLVLLTAFTACRRDDPKSLALELLPADESPLVAVRVLVEVGSAFDPPGKEGLCRLTWSLLAEGGSQSRTAGEIAAALAATGTTLRVETAAEWSALSAVVRREDWDAFYVVLREALLEPGFREDDFARLKAAQIDRLRESQAGAGDAALTRAAMERAVYEGGPLAHGADGWIDALESITLDETRAFYAESFVRGNLTIGLAGGYGTDVPERMRTDFNRLLPTFTPRLVAAPPRLPRGTEVVLADRPGPAASVALAWPLPVGRDDEDFFALWLAAVHLGGPDLAPARFVQALRDERGIAPGGFAGLGPGLPEREEPVGLGLPARYPYFLVRLGPADPKAVPFLVRWAGREVRSLAEDGLTDERFGLVRDYLLRSLARRESRLEDRLALRMEARFLGRDDLVAEARRILPGLSAGDVRAAVRRHLDPESAFVAVLAPDAASLRELLLAGAPPPLPPGREEPAEDAATEILPLKARPEFVRAAAALDLVRPPAAPAR